MHHQSQPWQRCPMRSAHLAAANHEDVPVANLPGQNQRAAALDVRILALHGVAWGNEEGAVLRGDKSSWPLASHDATRAGMLSIVDLATKAMGRGKRGKRRFGGCDGLPRAHFPGQERRAWSALRRASTGGCWNPTANPCATPRLVRRACTSVLPGLGSTSTPRAS